MTFRTPEVINSEIARLRNELLSVQASPDVVYIGVYETGLGSMWFPTAEAVRNAGHYSRLVGIVSYHQINVTPEPKS